MARCPMDIDAEDCALMGDSALEQPSAPRQLLPRWKLLIIGSLACGAGFVAFCNPQFSMPQANVHSATGLSNINLGGGQWHVKNQQIGDGNTMMADDHSVNHYDESVTTNYIKNVTKIIEGKKCEGSGNAFGESGTGGTSGAAQVVCCSGEKVQCCGAAVGASDMARKVQTMEDAPDLVATETSCSSLVRSLGDNYVGQLQIGDHNTMLKTVLQCVAMPCVPGPEPDCKQVCSKCVGSEMDCQDISSEQDAKDVSRKSFYKDLERNWHKICSINIPWSMGHPPEAAHGKAEVAFLMCSDLQVAACAVYDDNQFDCYMKEMTADDMDELMAQETKMAQKDIALFGKLQDLWHAHESQWKTMDADLIKCVTGDPCSDKLVNKSFDQVFEAGVEADVKKAALDRMKLLGFINPQ